jgi:HYR domain/RTX calcium-binding nonapeptide repeat (4 copies)
VDSDLQVGGELVLPLLPLTPPEEDTIPPVLTVPEDMTVVTTSLDGAVVSFEVRARDNVDGTAILGENNMLIQDNVGGSITISCNPPSDSRFPLGETVVQCTATDAAGNTATASFTVTVVISCAGVPTTRVGTPGDDTIIGTDGRDVIQALAGNDRVEARGGDDLICGDEGDDSMSGGAGADGMVGEAGDDFLNSVDDVVNNDDLDVGTGTADTCVSDPDPEVNCELPP